MYNWLKKRLDPWVKLYSIIPLITAFSFNMIVYFVTMRLCKDWYHYDLTLDFDRQVPFVPEWIYVYLICYLFWVVNYIMSARFGKERFYRFITADLSSRVVCLLFYLLLPTTNVRPEVIGSGLAEEAVRWLYATDLPTNLFPSIHCLVSWFCYIAIRGRKEIPRWYRAFSCLFALAVVASTQFTKQHYIVDAIGGIALAEAAWWLSNRFSYYQRIKKVFEIINDRLEQRLLK